MRLNALAKMLEDPSLEASYAAILQRLNVPVAGLQAFFEGMAKRTNGSFKVNPISVTPVGDELLVSSKPTGTLVVDHLLPGRNLYLIST